LNTFAAPSRFRPAFRTGPLLASAAVVLLAAGCRDESPPAATTTDTASPWPAVAWPLDEDPAIEKRIDELMAKMTVEEKISQIVQGDLASLTPEDVRKYRLGSVLAGGNSDPGGKYNATPAQWLALADAFYEASMDTGEGGHAIQVLFGIDAVHGQSNIVGATLLPHNIGLGATRNRGRRSCEVGSAAAPGNRGSLASPAVAGGAGCDERGRTRVRVTQTITIHDALPSPASLPALVNQVFRRG